MKDNEVFNNFNFEYQERFRDLIPFNETGEFIGHTALVFFKKGISTKQAEIDELKRRLMEAEEVIIGYSKLMITVKSVNSESFEVREKAREYLAKNKI
jgi:hypothetical protein